MQLGLQPSGALEASGRRRKPGREGNCLPRAAGLSARLLAASSLAGGSLAWPFLLLLRILSVRVAGCGSQLPRIQLVPEVSVLPLPVARRFE